MVSAMLDTNAVMLIVMLTCLITYWIHNPRTERTDDILNLLSSSYFRLQDITETKPHGLFEE